MADNSNNLRDIKTSLINLGMNKDLDPQLLKEGQYTHAINAMLNSHNGEFSFIQNEPSNIKCIELSKPFISSIQLKDNKHLLFIGEGVDSEIGVFDENICTYKKLVSNKCLNFSKNYPIKGVSKENTDCTETAYWSDNNNPNRYLNISKIPYTYTFDDDTCETKIYTTTLDCDALRLDQLIDVPCLNIKLSQSGGVLKNGSYQAAIAYSINGQRVSSYYSTTPIVSIFIHENTGGAVEVNISNIDKDFNEFKLYILQTVNNQTVVYEEGTYAISVDNITVSNLRETTTVPLKELLLNRTIYEKSRDLIMTDNRALWIGATTKQELNYQKQALNIKGEWVAYRVPKDYYKNGGTLVGYMRDEVYGFGIQWLYNTGDWSPVYHIPGPELTGGNITPVGNDDAYEIYSTKCDKTSFVPSWKVYNTASGKVTGIKTADNCDEFEITSGKLGGWQSETNYPDNKELFQDLACTPIRHFRMPDDCKVPRYMPIDSNGIILLGIKFNSIEHPVDDDGNKISNIIGYRILRTDRNNNKSIFW